MRIITAIAVGLAALILCGFLVNRLGQTPAPHDDFSTPPGYTENIPAEPGEGPAGLPTPRL